MYPRPRGVQLREVLPTDEEGRQGEDYLRPMADPAGSPVKTHDDAS